MADQSAYFTAQWRISAWT